MNQAIMGAVASSVAGGFEGTIIEQDDFTGITINTGKWSKNDAGNSITQNNRIIMNPTLSTGDRFSGYDIRTINSATSGIVTLSANYDFNAATTNFGMIKLGSAKNSYAGIVNQYNGNNFQLEIAEAGSLKYNVSTGISGINQNFKVKITYDITTHDIKFFYWNGSWTQMGITKNYNIGSTLKAELMDYQFGGSASFRTYVDNLYLTEGDFETETPT